MAANLGTAYIKIAPDLSGVQGSISKGLSGAVTPALAKTNKSAAAGLAALAKTGAKLAGGAVVAVGGAVAGMAIKGGISRALNIEDAQAKLKGLGHDTKAITTIMDNALASVKGTAFGLGDAATVASSAVASGIKPGKELEQVLKTVANSAAIAGIDLDSMGNIFNKVAATGKLTGRELQQLGQAGVPVLEFLAKELGVTADAVSDMVSRGEVDFATFERAMREGVGDAALAMGDTTRGAWENLQAALSRVGEKIVEGPLKKIKEGMGDLTEWIDENDDKIAGAFDGVVNAIASIKDSETVANIVESLKTAFDAIEPVLEVVGEQIKDTLWPAIKNLGTALEPYIPLLKLVAGLFGGVLLGALVVASFAVLGLVEAVAWIVNKFSDFINWGTKLNQKVHEIRDRVINMARQIKDRVLDDLGRVVNFFRDIPGKVLGVFKNAGSLLKDVGRDMISGLLNGIGSMLPRIASYMLDKLPSAIRGPFKKALGIASPSKEFAMYGKNIVQGVELGVDKNTGIAERAVTDMADGLLIGARTTQSTATASTVGSRASASAVVTQTNNVYTDIDMDKVVRDMTWELGRI